jgi:ABC-type uncharacterized transport system substrate-binding protein
VRSAIPTLSALLFTLCGSAQAERAKDLRLVVIGAPEEPKFSEIVAGLKKRLEEISYAPHLRNTTAMTYEYPELSGNRLELMKEIAPQVRRVLTVYDPRDPAPRQGIAAARLAARNLGLTLVEREARSQSTNFAAA